MIFSFRQTDPEIEIQWAGEVVVPVIRERLPSDSAHEFVEKKTKRARVITVPGPRRPQRSLFLQRTDNVFVFGHVHRFIKSAKPGLMRKQLRERDLFLPGLRKLRPELRDALFDVDLVFLQDMQHAGAAESLGRRPNENERVGGPRLFAARVAKSAVKIDNRFSVLPNRNRRAEFAELLEIFLESNKAPIADGVSGNPVALFCKL